MTSSIETDFKKEFLRKGIHLMSISIPIFYSFNEKPFTLSILVTLFFFSLLVDICRLYFENFKFFFHKLFNSILREHEITSHKKNLTGATYILLSSIICILVFPKHIAITSLSILIISDSLSAIVGRKFGHHHFKNLSEGKKTWEGSIAFVLSAFAVVIFTPKISNLFMEYIIMLFSSIGGAFAEVISFNFLDDNLAIPITIGILMWIMYLFFLPNLVLANDF